ncbi:MAG TPA: hypothetical protein VHO25_16620, partial [Polyangiaceae bacterium]|nr:hypothetical protein [Polyangiaceae bacterium]
DPSLWPEVLEISADRDAAFGSPPVQLRRSDTRAYRVVERVAEGYTREQLREAFEGAALDDHIKSNAQFQGLGTLLRDAAQVDRFRALRASPPKPKTKGCAPLQPNAGKTGFESLEET